MLSQSFPAKMGYEFGKDHLKGFSMKRVVVALFHLYQ